MAIIALAVLWEVASWFFPPFLFPPLGSIARIYVEIVTTWADFANAGATGLRILAGMTGAFVLGSIIAVLMAKYNRFYDYLFPILNFNQGDRKSTRLNSSH